MYTNPPPRARARQPKQSKPINQTPSPKSQTQCDETTKSTKNRPKHIREIRENALM
jgi:hypothetical protein